MTYKDSICVSCSNLDAANAAVCITNGKPNLISTCFYGGKNAGNRKTCKKYRKASDSVIERRMALLSKYEVKE